MKKEDELLKELTDMVKETKKGQIKWKLGPDSMALLDMMHEYSICVAHVNYNLRHRWLKYDANAAVRRFRR